MTSATDYARYAEAVTVLATVDERRRAALRKAVEDAAAAEDDAKATIAHQQRMYARAARDIDDAERGLGELRTAVGLSPTTHSATATSTASDTRPLATIRGDVADVTAWIADTRPVLESLVRSRTRLMQAPSSSPATPAPSVPPVERVRAKWPIWALGATAALVIVIVIVVITAINP